MRSEGWEQKLSKIMHTGSFAYDDILNFIRRIAAQERQAGRDETADFIEKNAVPVVERVDRDFLRDVIAAARSPKDE
jgi:hypothetical protein